MSTDEQAHTTTLSDITQDMGQESQSADARAWQPDDERECHNCGATVNAQYRRVLGDENNEVHECPRCPDDESNASRRCNGAAAGLDVDERKMTTADTHLEQ